MSKIKPITEVDSKELQQLYEATSQVLNTLANASVLSHGFPAASSVRNIFESAFELTEAIRSKTFNLDLPNNTQLKTRQFGKPAAYLKAPVKQDKQGSMEDRDYGESRRVREQAGKAARDPSPIINVPMVRPLKF